jgi:hypothetical protein
MDCRVKPGNDTDFCNAVGLRGDKTAIDRKSHAGDE